MFFSLGILFFSARPRRFGEKKVTRNIEKKAHGLRQAVLHLCPRLKQEQAVKMAFQDDMIGASLSEPHTDVLAWDSVTRDIYIYIYIYTHTSSRN